MEWSELVEYISLYIHYLSIPFRIFIIFFFYFLGIIVMIIMNNDYLNKVVVRLWAIIMIRMHSINIIYDKNDIIKYEHYMKTYDNTLVLYNHRTIYDPFLLMCICDNITFLLKTTIPSYFPLFKIIFDIMRMVYIEKGKTTDAIINYTNNRKSSERLLAIAPDGGDYPEDPDFSDIAKFKTGAFVGMFPVIPIIIKYNNKEYLDHKFENDRESFLHCACKGFLNRTYNVKIKVLDMIYPDKNSSIEQYRDKVYDIMNYEYYKL